MTTPWVRSVLAEPEIDADTERDLARRARAGDAEARAALIRSGLRHVVQRARMLGFRGDAFDDAVQSGCLGLIRAVDRFDPEGGARLRTYAWWWIGDAMRSAVPVVTDPLPDDLAAASSSDVKSADLPLAEVPEVLRLRFGLDEPAGRSRPRHEVARLLGLTESQVRDREAQAMRQLRQGLAKVVHRAPAEGADPP
ncbi:sigma-70 family RNA polymerase sigma factor [Aeromicrobium sp. Leaf350]|uniref:sigma-70 family RNA polymerase sigma factor n=1 Tax=Aeromicrobium sp. Leaf350 TaxID=2876565 RepID=UPI001E310064|nr:sigma-70 family RNA polymerase sigma factor [Aeromicrobium sp. Leaf350]